MICSRCKLKINEDDDTCPYCGEPNKAHQGNDNDFVIQSESETRSVPEQKYFFKAFLDIYKKYFDFSGTTGRGEFWSVELIVTLLLLPFTIIYVGVEPETVILTSSQVWIVNLTALFLFVSFIPLMALTVRRLHDANLTGFFVFLNIIPGFGNLILLALLLMAHKDNKYESKKIKGE